MFSPKLDDAALRAPDKSELPKLFDSIGELKMAVVTLDTAIARVLPQNQAFRTLCFYLLSNDYGDSDLGGKSTKVQILTGFVNKVLLLNAKAWVEKKKYFSHQDLSSKCKCFLELQQHCAVECRSPQKETETQQILWGMGWKQNLHHPQVDLYEIQKRGLQRNQGQA